MIIMNYLDYVHEKITKELIIIDLHQREYFL